MRYIILLLLIPFVCGAPSATSKTLLSHVISAVEKVLGFFNKDYSDINVDGLFGLRLGQGQLIEAVKDCKDNPGCTDDVLLRLRALEKSLSYTCDKAIPYVKELDENYYTRFRDTIDKPYLLPYKPTSLNLSDPNTRVGTDSSYDEEKGDACYARLMGTFKENDKLLPKCNVTSNCFDYLSSGDKSGYAITHQLLYFIVVENVGCTSALENEIHGDKVWDIQRRFCGRIYKEASKLVSSRQVFERRDLFLEQSVLCGSLGFEDFMREDWINMALRWPDKQEGCFKMNLQQAKEETDKVIDAIAEIEGITSKTEIKQEEKQAEQKVAQEYVADSSSLFGSQSTMRKLLREKTMKDGCLSHTTGLGFGAFSAYLRYLVRHL